LRVVAYASRTLMPAEKVYCTTRKEQLAMVYGLKQFGLFIVKWFALHSALMYLTSLAVKTSVTRPVFSVPKAVRTSVTRPVFLDRIGAEERRGG